MKYRIVFSRSSGRGALGRLVSLGLVFGATVGWLMVANAATTRLWTGSIDNKWSNPNNWSPTGTPQPGEVLSFTSGGGSLVNDLAGVVVEDMYFHGDTWELSGSEIVIGGFWVGEEHTSGATVFIDCPLRLGSLCFITIT